MKPKLLHRTRRMIWWAITMNKVGIKRLPGIKGRARPKEERLHLIEKYIAEKSKKSP